MTDDTPDIAPGHVAIVGVNGEVLNKDAQKKPARRTHADRRDFAQLRHLDELREDMVAVVQKVNDAIPVAALEVAQKMYDQMSAETATYLEEMEQDLFDRLVRRMEERRVRGRIRRAWATVGDFFHLVGMELGLVSPIPKTPALEIVRDKDGMITEARYADLHPSTSETTGTPEDEEETEQERRASKNYQEFLDS